MAKRYLSFQVLCWILVTSFDDLGDSNQRHNESLYPRSLPVRLAGIKR